jgi:hydroxymethylpyrimidine/phosphomethylpyrimidine kinase
MQGRILIIAGSDSGGGAGIQADIKTVTAMGGFATTAVTALTAQNTLGVRGVLAIDPAFVRQQIDAVLDDIGADCVKTGMLHDVPVIETVADALEERAAETSTVVDPVFYAKGGDRLLVGEAVDAVRKRMLPLATVLTPNIPEAAELSGLPITSVGEQIQAAQRLCALGATWVLLKGGRATGDVIHDVIASEDEIEVLESPRLETRNTHGTGCTLASAIAVGLGQGLSVRSAIARAREYVRVAMIQAPDLGGGHGPLEHGHTVQPFRSS